MDLSKKNCHPCEGGIPPLSHNEIEGLRKNISDAWVISDDSKISREYLLINYHHTMDFVNKVADLAEKEGHHPVMHVYYSRVVVDLWTHSINGLSENDFILAAKIDKL